MPTDDTNFGQTSKGLTSTNLRELKIKSVFDWIRWTQFLSCSRMQSENHKRKLTNIKLNCEQNDDFYPEVQLQILKLE